MISVKVLELKNSKESITKLIDLDSLDTDLCKRIATAVCAVNRHLKEVQSELIALREKYEDKDKPQEENGSFAVTNFDGYHSELSLINNKVITIHGEKIKMPNISGITPRFFVELDWLIC